MGFIQDIFEALLYEVAQMWANIFEGLGDTVFYIEHGLDGVISDDLLSEMFLFVQAFAISLILLKILKKGFWTYVLWKDGDADQSIQQSVVNLVLAVVIALSFSTLYDWFAQVCLWLIEKLSLSTFDMMGLDTIESYMETVLTHTFSGVMCVIALIYFIMLFILYLQFLKRSAELLVLRLGFPLACLGLLDSDNGVFTTTVKTFLQVALTTIAQLFFMMWSMTIFVRAHTSPTSIFYCIAFAMAAFATPRMLQFILMPTGGGGAGQKVTGAVHTVSLVKGLIGK